MSEKETKQRLERLRSQVWGHLERGNWHSAAMLAEYMSELDSLSSITGLTETTRALAMISEAVRLKAPIDQNAIARLDEISSTWPRLYAMPSYQDLLRTVEQAVVEGQDAQTMESAVGTEVPPQHLPPSIWKSTRRLLRRSVLGLMRLGKETEMMAKMRAKDLLRSFGFPEWLAILGIVVVVAVCAIKWSFFFMGTALGASLIAYLLAFLVTSYGLKRQGFGLERVFCGVIGTASARWLMEVVYHYSYPGAHSLSRISTDLFYLSTNIGEGKFPLIWSLWMVICIFAFVRHMSINKWFLIALLISMVTFYFWYIIGFPQWTDPSWWPVSRPLFYVIPPEYRHAPTDAAANTISLVALVCNSITKISWCLVLPLLLLGKNRRLRRPNPEREPTLEDNPERIAVDQG